MKRTQNILFRVCLALALHSVWGRATETVYWSDNFETNAGVRWTTNNVWQIGMPTFGPAGTHTGYNCVTTGLKTSAPAFVDARLICTNYNGTSWLLVPAANQFPRLRFWQWYDFVNSGGYVEIRQQSGNTNWQTLSITNQSIGKNPPSYSSGVWSRPSIDLSAFAGQNVQIAFHFTDGGSGYGNDPGWYIDDVVVATGRPAFINNNPESFEAGLGDWAVDTGTWEVGKPTSGSNAAHGGTNCAGTVLAGNYGWNMDTRLISPPFFVPTTNNPHLRFWQWYNFVNAGGFVEIKTNNGSWQSISQTNKSFAGAVVASAGWTNANVDLGNYAGQTVQVAFHFQSGGSGWGNAPGWYVDDVALVANPRLTVPATQTIYAGQSMNLTNYATLLPTTGTPFFELLSPPTTFTNLNLNATNGVLTWNTTAAQPPSTNTIAIKVTETNVPALNNTPALTSTNSFIIQVLSPPPPVLTVPTIQTINAGQTLIVTNSATNSVFPNCAFTFGISNHPPNVSIDSTNGILTWTNTAAAAPSTNTITVTVSDNNSPPLRATNSFTVIINLPSPPQLTVSFTNGFQFTFNTFSNTTWRIEAATNLTAPTWLPIFTNLVGIGGTLQFTDLLATNFSAKFYRAVLQ